MRVPLGIALGGSRDASSIDSRHRAEGMDGSVRLLCDLIRQLQDPSFQLLGFNSVAVKTALVKSGVCAGHTM